MAKLFVLIVAAYIVVNIYLLARVRMTLQRSAARTVLCAAILLFSLSFPTGTLLGHMLPRPLSSALIAAGSCYFAPMIYAALFTLIADVLRILNMHFSITRLSPPYGPRGRARMVLAIAMLTFIVCTAGWINAHSPRPVSHEIEYETRTGLSSFHPSIKIALISDLHFGRLVGADTLRRVAELVGPEAPDILIFAGDVIDDTDWMLDEMSCAEVRSIIDAMTPRLGAWAVTGNHEYYAGVDSCVDFLRSAGVRVLRDEWAEPGGEIALIGREDASAARYGWERAELSQIMPAHDRERIERLGTPIIVIDHQPTSLSDARDLGASLQLSGHTHRGQLFPFNFVTSAIFERDYGLYKMGSTNYYISCGAGTWGPPFRTSSRPEVVFITLKRKY